MGAAGGGDGGGGVVLEGAIAGAGEYDDWR